ncbi:MAG: hypothetical protein SFY69_12140 [Planctomycetota bacterium]|nr:hypothetical protein [Planctomycetota bacterium]
MEACKVDPALARTQFGDFRFPLGAYPVEPMTPRPGYALQFEPADGGEDDADWEEWPDRYVFDIVISAERVEPLCRMLFALLPPRVYPILDVLGHDAYREIDPYIAYDLVSLERFLDGVRRYRDFLLEDGLVGFGAMSEEPFVYVFVDEHKILTVRVQPEYKDRVEKILHAFDLENVEEPAGADSAAHEHRTALLAPEDQPDLLDPDQIVERLRDDWQLVLNIDPDSNVDDDAQPLGDTHWRCIARCHADAANPAYAEIILRAPDLRHAEETAFDAIDLLSEDATAWDDVVIVSSNRLKPEQVRELKGLRKLPSQPESGGHVVSARWLGE